MNELWQEDEDFHRGLLDRLLTSAEEEGEEHASGDEASNENAIFNVAIATIFAREFLEACVIIGQYRTVIKRSDFMSPERKEEALKIVTRSSLVAAFLAIVVVIAVAVPLGVLGNELDKRVVEIIEGLSKIVAAVCILQLSVKIPVWLGLYKKVSVFPCKKYDPSKQKDVDNVTNKELYFNVAWNIWREVAECGIFLIPFFLGGSPKAIPVSALVGIAIGLVLGIGIYLANHVLKNKVWLAFFMSGITLFLSVGLFVGGAHEFEEVWGETPKVYQIENPNAADDRFPMAIFKPFGYSDGRTVLQITTFWCWLSLGCLLHGIKYKRTQNIRAQYPEEEDAAMPFDAAASAAVHKDKALNGNDNDDNEDVEGNTKATTEEDTTNPVKYSDVESSDKGASGSDIEDVEEVAC